MFRRVQDFASFLEDHVYVSLESSAYENGAMAPVLSPILSFLTHGNPFVNKTLLTNISTCTNIYRVLNNQLSSFFLIFYPHIHRTIPLSIRFSEAEKGFGIFPKRSMLLKIFKHFKPFNYCNLYLTCNHIIF